MDSFNLEALRQLLADEEAYHAATMRRVPLPPKGRLVYPRFHTACWVAPVNNEDVQPDVVVESD